MPLVPCSNMVRISFNHFLICTPNFHSCRVHVIVFTVTANADPALRVALVNEVSDILSLGSKIICISNNFIMLCPRSASCATTLTIIPDKTLAANIKLSGAGVLGQVDSDLSNTPQCSGHGLCKTMREMGNEFNGQ